MAVFLVEHYAVDVSESAAARLAGRLGRAAKGRGVSLLGSGCVPGDEAFISLLAAPSADEVALVVADAGVVPDRIVRILWQGGSAVGGGRPAAQQVP